MEQGIQVVGVRIRSVGVHVAELIVVPHSDLVKPYVTLVLFNCHIDADLSEHILEHFRCRNEQLGVHGRANNVKAIGITSVCQQLLCLFDVLLVVCADEVRRILGNAFGHQSLSNLTVAFQSADYDGFLYPGPARQPDGLSCR